MNLMELVALCIYFAIVPVYPLPVLGLCYGWLGIIGWEVATVLVPVGTYAYLDYKRNPPWYIGEKHSSAHASPSLYRAEPLLGNTASRINAKTKPDSPNQKQNEHHDT